MARTRITKNPDKAASVASWTKNVANATTSVPLGTTKNYFVTDSARALTKNPGGSTFVRIHSKNITS